MSNIKDLKFDDKNFNDHTEYGMSLLEKSLQDYGAGRSILIDKNNNIIAGNGIVEAAAQAGIENVRIVETQGEEIVAVKRTDIDLHTQKGREMAFADNATASVDLSWNKDNIGEFFTPEDTEKWGVDLDWEKEQEIQEDEAPEVNESEPAKSELGKVYHLGKHRLMCGDSTDAGSVAILMDGQKADMVFTDPPYGMKLDTDYSKIKGSDKSPKAMGYKWDKVIGDNKDFDPRPLFAMLNDVKEQFWWGCDYYFECLPRGGSLLVWQKRDKADAEMIGNDFEICWSKTRHKKATFWKRWVGFDSIEKGDKRVHPTQKPVALCGWIIESHSDNGSIVIDLFGGSGSTLIACEQLGRKCYMMELDPKYCDVIRKRYWKFVNGSEEGWEDGTRAK